MTKQEESAMDTRRLPVSLTKEQVALRADKLAQILQQRSEKVQERDQVKEAAKNRVKDLEAEIESLEIRSSDLASVVRNRSEKQDVAVRWERNEDANPPLMELYRTDTGELVDSRPMTLEERQRPFKFPSPQEEEEDEEQAAEV